MRETGKSLNNSIFICRRYFNVIWRLDPDKTRGHYQIGIRLINLCDKVLCKPLYTVFPSCMRSGIFPTEWEIANVAPIHRRDAKKVSKVIDLYLCQHLGKNLNVSFTITCAQLFFGNNFISPNQSGFKQGVPCINPFDPNAPFLYLLKILQSFNVLWCFQVVEKGYIGNKLVNYLLSTIHDIYHSLDEGYEPRGAF